MIYLHKIVPVFLSPIFIVLVLLIIGMATRRRSFVLVGACLLYLSSVPIVSDVLRPKADQTIQRLTPSDVATADAVVVLSMGMSWVNTKGGFIAQWPLPNRFFGGIEVFKEGKAALLVFTGGKLPWQGGDETEGQVLTRYAQLMQVPVDKILVTEKVENTEQEAIGVRKLLMPSKKQIILVTSAFHMRRAKQIFEHEGFSVQPYPVDFGVLDTHRPDVTLRRFLPDPGALSAIHRAQHELLGRLYHYVKHL